MTARILLINVVITTLLACSVVGADKNLQSNSQVTVNQTTQQKSFPQKTNSKDYAPDQVIVNPNVGAPVKTGEK